jgi:hypothetical protein
MSTAEISLPSVPETEELATTKIPLPSVPETAALGITLLGASSETPALPECTASEITAVATGKSAAPPPAGFSTTSRRSATRGPQLPSPPTSPGFSTTSCRSATRGPQRPSPPTSPIVAGICCNRRILPESASANPRRKLLFVCCTGGHLSISIVSRNPGNTSWSRMKFPSLTKLFSCFGGCLPCNDCAVTVNCCVSGNNNANRGQDVDSAREAASAPKPAPMPDLISM